MNEIVDVIVLTQNLKLQSLKSVIELLNKEHGVLLVSTHHFFENEIIEIQKIIGPFVYTTFSDLLLDSEMEFCDRRAYELESKDIEGYYITIKKLKNELVIRKLSEKYNLGVRIIVSDDLGIDLQIWIKNGYKWLELDYYYSERQNEKELHKSFFKKIKGYLNKPVYSARIDNKKIVFYGSMNRINYRMAADFKLDKMENWRFVFTAISAKVFKHAPVRKNVEHISTLHESTGWRFPKIDQYRFGIIQDGYLPPNYSSLYLKFINSNGYYYAWDTLGMQVFKNQNISVKMLPFRKKLYIPNPVFKPIKTALCVASGAGDWTAMKNRSDEDLMIIAFVEIAKRHPEIKFVYRCHPTWIHPAHQGLNSINRVAEYFSWLHLPNLVLSGNIPLTDLNSFQLSFTRNSLAEDLKDADIVFGEHSVSMIDAAFKKIPFSSVNMTGRRDFFCGMTELGFPHCESLEEIDDVISGFENKEFVSNYIKAIERYNRMTDEE